MKCLLLVLLILLGERVLTSPVTDTSSLVTAAREPTKEGSDDNGPKPVRVNPEIYSMQVSSNVSNRFARTLITSKVRNLVNISKETTFSVILPENAFISEFEMEIDGKVYKAYVKEKEEAKQIYQEAVARGQSAAHVELSARDSKTFTVSANIEPEGAIYFRLVYEELLQKRLGQYELVVNIHPGQIVPILEVQVHINESRPLKFVRTPSLRTGNEISKNEDKLDPSADIQFQDNKTATVRFDPDVHQQREFAEKLGGEKENGLAGQFVVQYDVERDPQGGEVLVKDGYFVHFFAPDDLKPLPKHVVFVLDHSGSMGGRKIEQLTEAMQFILSDLKAEDLFNIVRFSDEASVWNADNNLFEQISLTNPNYGHLELELREANLPAAVQATSQNTQKAKDAIKDTSDLGITNIIAGLEVGLFLIKKTQEKNPDKYQPMIVFLTDGHPNAGMRRDEDIIKTVNELNSGPTKTALFSLSFGDSAEKGFLRKLSSQNLGFSRHIYEASDASLQLQDFYKTISAPLLSNITFNYVDTVSDVTKTHYPLLFNGSELVVAGKIGHDFNTLSPVMARCSQGLISWTPTRREPVSSLERLWAYLTVKQILAESEVVANNTELKKKALDLALKYSFVTEVSSLVVVKPNETSSSDAGIPRPSNKAGFVSSGSGYSSGPGYSSGSGSGYSGSPKRGFRGHAGTYAPMPGMFYSAPSHRSGLHLAHPYGRYPRPLSEIVPSFSPTTRRVPLGPQKPTSKPDPAVPQWLNNLKTQNGNITTPQGTFQLGKTGDVVAKPDCPSTPMNGTGVCTLIFDCPQVLSLLTDVSVYLTWFCPLNQFAGVCCPVP